MIDAPDVAEASLTRSLDGLGLVNGITFSLRLLWPEIVAASKRKHGRPVRVLDVATGGGDMLVRLHRKAERSKLPIEIAGCDKNPSVLAYAASVAEAAAAPVDLFRYDAASDSLPEGFDVILSSLFLHHLDDQESVAFLQEAAARTGDRLIIHDVARSRAGFWFVRLGSPLLLLSEMFRIDGERSVEGAFTASEVADLARKAGLSGVEVRARMPFRFVMRWVRPEVAASGPIPTFASP